jgi:hypothetical protein
MQRCDPVVAVAAVANTVSVPASFVSRCCLSCHGINVQPCF